MLTKSDLSEIRKIIREEVENEAKATKDEVQAEIKMSRIRIQTDIEELKDRIKNLEIRVTKMHKELKNEIKMVVDFLDYNGPHNLHGYLRLSYNSFYGSKVAKNTSTGI